MHGTHDGEWDTAGLTVCFGPGPVAALPAYAGVWEALAEQEVPVCGWSGSGAGAVVAALAAGGRLDGAALLRLLARVRPDGLACRGLPWRRHGGLCTPGALPALLRAWLPEDFADLARPVVLGASCCDQDENCPVLFGGGGELRRKVLAAWSLPGLYPSVRINGRRFAAAGVDGGLLPGTESAGRVLLVTSVYRRRPAGTAVDLLAWQAAQAAHRALQPAAAYLQQRLGDRFRWLEVDLGRTPPLRLDLSLAAGARQLVHDRLAVRRAARGAA